MKILDLFPSKVVIDVLDNIPDNYIESCKDTILNKLDLLSVKDSPQDFISDDQYILNRFPELKSQILKHINYYASLLPCKTVEHQICSSWAYISKKNNITNNFHKHGNSNLSGVFYLTEGAPITFTEKHRFEQSFPFYPGDGEGKSSDVDIPIKSKQLIIFPSYLDHAIKINKIEGDRISIAFNVVPKGEIGNRTSKLIIHEI